MTADGPPIRVVMVVPPAATEVHHEVLDRASTLTRTLCELNADGRVEASACCATTRSAETLHRGGIRYEFVPASQLADAVAAHRPRVVHVHGTGFVRTLGELASALPRHTAIVVQHHGEPPGPWRNRVGHRLVRGRVDCWLLTGADHGQADPFRAAGVIRRNELVSEVLEAASLLAPSTERVELAGDPAVLWVGRFIGPKDPLTAVRAFGLCAERVGGAHLHLLATERTLEATVRDSIAALGAASSRVHVWDRVEHAAMPGWYAGADVLLSTSRREGSNYSLIEAMTEGCSPVVTGLASHRSIIGPGVDTFVPGDADGAAQLLARATDTDRRAVRAWAAEHLSWAAVVEQLVGTYREVLRPIGR